MLSSIATPTSVTFLVIVWVILWTAIGSAIGKRRGRPVIGAIICAAFGPLGALFVWLARDEMVERDYALRHGMQQCWSCAELVQGAAVTCRYCRADLSKWPKEDFETGEGS